MWERFKNTSKIYIKIFRKYLRYCCSVLRQNKRRLYIGPLIINKKNLITLFNQTLVYNNQGAHRAIFKRFYRSNKTFLVSVFHLLFFYYHLNLIICFIMEQTKAQSSLYKDKIIFSKKTLLVLDDLNQKKFDRPLQQRIFQKKLIRFN